MFFRIFYKEQETNLNKKQPPAPAQADTGGDFFNFSKFMQLLLRRALFLESADMR